MLLLAFSVVAALLISLIAGPWLHGYPTDKFWIVWAILALTKAVVAGFAAVLQRLIGAAGTLA